jgi:hypothetical protein
MFTFFSASRTASVRLAARAFTTSTGARRLAVRPVASRFTYVQSFTTQVEATVEEELDAALDGILADAFKDAGGGVAPGTHMEGSKPMPKTLVEVVSNQ